MLTCIYHPIHDMQVVEDDVAAEMLASGFWFDSPLKAKQYREKVEQDIKDEAKAEKSKAKKRGKEHENGTQTVS